MADTAQISLPSQLHYSLSAIRDSANEHSYFLVELFANHYKHCDWDEGQQQRETNAYMFMNLYNLIDQLHKQKAL